MRFFDFHEAVERNKRINKKLIKSIYFVIIFILIEISISFSQSWQRIDAGFQGHFRDIEFINNDTGFVAVDGFPYEIMKTIDGGYSWEAYEENSWSGLHSIFFVDQDTGFAVGGGGGGQAVIRKTYDGGNNWDIFFPFNSGLENWPALFSVFFTNSFTGYAVGATATGEGLILKTTDAGQTWDSLEVNIESSLWSVFFTSSDTGFVVGGAGIILRTVDRGNNWQTSYCLCNKILRDIYFTNNQDGFVVGDSGTIIVTNNAGESWSILETNLFNDLNVVQFISDTTGYIAGEEGLLLKTEDFGITWKKQNTNLSNRIESIYFFGEYRGFLCGSHGLIAKSNYPPVRINSIPNFHFKANTGTHLIIDNLNNYFYDIDNKTIIYSGFVIGKAATLNITGDSLSIFTIPDSFGICQVIVTATDDFPQSVNDTFNIVIEGPEKLVLYQNFPNPFNSNTLIKFALPNNEKVKITIYNSLGQKIKVLYDDLSSKGFHTVKFNGDGLASGYYYYQIATENDIKSRKMLNLK